MRALALGFACAAFALGLSLLLGGSGFGLPSDSWLLQARVLRSLAALITGMGLALAGVWAQALFRNELVEPFLLGLSGGAAAGAVSWLLLFPGSSPAFGAALGALAAAGCVRSLAWKSDAALLLTGVTLGSMAASLAGLLLSTARQSQLLRPASHWLWGGYGDPPRAALLAAGLLLVAAGAATRIAAPHLDRLLLGDDLALALGTPVRATRTLGFALIAALTASSVLLFGIIGFVGLLAPHAARRLASSAHASMPLVAALLGGALLVLSDALARSAFAPREVPTGLLTSLCGAPVFLLVLRRHVS